MSNLQYSWPSIMRYAEQCGRTATLFTAEDIYFALLDRADTEDEYLAWRHDAKEKPCLSG